VFMSIGGASWWRKGCLPLRKPRASRRVAETLAAAAAAGSACRAGLVATRQK